MVGYLISNHIILAYIHCLKHVKEMVIGRGIKGRSIRREREK